VQCASAELRESLSEYPYSCLRDMQSKWHSCQRDALLADTAFQSVISPTILSEYKDVLARPKFKFDQIQVAQVLIFIQLVSQNVVGKASGRQLPDTSDLPFLEAAIEGKATHIVTGNLKDFPESACQPIKPIGPAEFLKELSGK
jgi:predicted nucleic acid-binding protein